MSLPSALRFDGPTAICPRMSCRPCAGIVIALSLAAASASAQGLGDGDSTSDPGRRALRWNTGDQPHDVGAVTPSPTRQHGEQHPFVFTLDPSTPFAGEVGVEYLVQGASGVEANRPLAANLGAQGVVHGLTVRYGATNGIAPFVSGLVMQPVNVDGATSQATGQAGAQLQFTRPGAPFRLGAQTAVMREFGGDMGAFARMTASYDLGILRVAGNAHVEKVFAGGRDGIDLLAFAGASVRATDSLRIGAEYVGQDLEDAVESNEAEGGARHFAGAVAAMELAKGAFWLTGGPAFGLNKQSPDLMGRLTVVALF